MYYIVYVMEAAGIGDPLLAASIQYILNVGLTIPAIVFLDRWGRRPSLLLGAFGMMVLLLVISGLQAAYGEPHYESRGPLAAISWVIKPGNNGVSQAIVACSYLFVCTFAVTWVSRSSHARESAECDLEKDRWLTTDCRARHPGPIRPKSSRRRSERRRSRWRRRRIGPSTASSPLRCRR